MNPIPYGKQTITEDDIKAVVETLKSDFLTQGPHIAEFENAFATYIGSKYAVAVANGTAALHLSAMALNVKPGQKVITSPITFVASANCIRYCGGEVVFADIDPSTYLIDIISIERLLRASPKGTYAGIIPVDFSGRPVDLEKLKSLANEFNLWILEDACHAPGGFFIDSKGEKQFCGNGKFAELAIFSFHPVKHIACGEGGMITTNDHALYEKLMVLRTHGITRNTKFFKNDPQWASGNTNESVSNFPAWYMEMQELGFNYRLTDFQAALGTSQLRRAEQGLASRKEIAQKYEAAFNGKAWVLGQSGMVEGHAYHLYILETENRLELYNFLKSKNIFPQIHYIPAHLMPYYKMLGYKEGDLIFAEQYYSRCLSLPMYPGLTDEQQNYVIENILAFSKR